MMGIDSVEFRESTGSLKKKLDEILSKIDLVKEDMGEVLSSMGRVKEDLIIIKDNTKLNA